MPTLTGTYNSTPSLTLAPTQNTAPVHEFQCLYTRDLHKKAKKWHDGSLRFHTFNSRVMVYDDSKNFIGDLHYRDTEPFGEGVEIQLDRGVKVEVGEPLGQTETDISTILDRPRSEKPVQPAKLLPAHTSQRPKSLLEVLGPSQRRNARSKLFSQSPFDQRQSLNLHDVTDRPSKRPRLSFEHDNHKQNEIGATTSSRSTEIPRLVRPALATSSKQQSRHLPRSPPPASSISFEEVVDILSDQDVPSRPLAQSRPNHVRLNLALPTTAPSQETATKPKLHPAKPAVSKQKTHLKKPQERPQPDASRASILPQPPDSRFARLLLRQPQPRQKLTYLLTRRGPSTSTTSPKPSKGSIHSPIHIGDTNSQSVGVSVDSASQIDLFQDSEEEICKSSHVPAGNDAGCSSPLFVPQEQGKPRSPSPVLFQAPDISSPSIGETQNSPRHDDTTTTDPTIQDPQINSTETSGPIVAGFEMSQSQPDKDDTATVLSQLDPIPFPYAHSTKGTLRRAFSASNAFEDEISGQDLGDDLVERSPLAVLENLSSRRSPVKRKSPAKLSRCASDTTTTKSHTEDSVEQRSESSPKGEIGPWTAEESFILFDWWPSELEKPDLWKAAPKVLPPTRNLPPVPEFSTRITTARQFLLNDVR